MNRFILTLGMMIVLLGTTQLKANNIHISRNLSLDIANMTTTSVKVSFALQWENSWRDDFNWDAAYVFLKYRLKGTHNWNQVYLRNGYHTVSDGYDWWLANTNGEGKENAQGIFIYRNKNGVGTADVDVSIHWNYSANGLSKTQLNEGDVEYTAMCIEMVYVPNGAFYLGDNYSNRTFQASYKPIPERLDIIKNDGTMTFDGDALANTDDFLNYPPSNAANRINMSGTSKENAWYSSQTKNGYWQVQFKEPKTIRYFGLSGISNVAAPTKWELYGGNSHATVNELLYSGTNVEWPADANNSYPVSMALKIEHPGSYLIYRIKIVESSTRPVLNNVSMTEADLSTVTDYAYVVDNFGTTLQMSTVGSTRGVFASDGDSWSGTIPAVYPSGVHGFFAMKYEISQEQYVKFLNKLTLDQQKLRTIGAPLTTLSVGDFVYGGDKTKPNNRNGIAVASVSVSSSPVIFANNLNYTDEAMSQDDDGKTLACNYLSPMDMLAYADWAGLRPMSEMEFEKAARGPFPDFPEQREFAWNKGEESTFKSSSSILNGGTESEKVGESANINAAATLGGPVRCGSFASGATERINTGASYWGLMEMSGNLAEICYNANIYGRPYYGNDYRAHGDGALVATGNANVSTTYWSQDVRAFGLRGGSFQSEMSETAISDRRNAKVYTDKSYDLNRKDSTTTFRLAHSFTSIRNESCTTYLRLANNRISTNDASAVDTVCGGSTYTIWGSDMLDPSTQKVKNYKGRVEYIWYMSENGGTTWNIIADARESSLKTDKFINDGSSPRNILVKRIMITPELISRTNQVTLQVVNPAYKVHALTDTINKNNQVIGCLIETKTPSDYIWRWKGQGQAAGQFRDVVKNSLSSFYNARRGDFSNLSGTNFTVECEIVTRGKCVNKVDMMVYVAPRSKVGVISSDIVMTGDESKKCGVEMVDPRDGNIYGTVRIGDQCWMAENLRYRVTGQTYHQALDPSGQTMGSFYVYNAVVRDEACPSGWKLPTNAEYATLKTYLNSDGFTNAGIKLKAGNYWNVTSSNYRLMGTNTSKFGAIGVGHYANYYVGRYAYFLTYEGHYFRLGSDESDLEGSWGAGGTAMSIRCIKK